MNHEHISQFAAEKLALFLKEEMAPQLLAKWQAHYRDCQQCRAYVDRSTKNQALAAQGEIAGQRLDRQLQKKLAAFEFFPPDFGGQLWQKLEIRRSEIDYLKQWFASHYPQLPAHPQARAAAATPYQVGENYATMAIPIDLPGSMDRSGETSLLQCSISFYWTDMMWGRVSLGSDHNAFSPEQCKMFLASLHIDLCQASENIVAGDLGVDKNGNFPISNDADQIKKIKQYLSDKSLYCLLKTRR